MTPTGGPIAPPPAAPPAAGSAAVTIANQVREASLAEVRKAVVGQDAVVSGLMRIM